MASILSFDENLNREFKVFGAANEKEMPPHITNARGPGYFI
jgi:hypothetical protein